MLSSPYINSWRLLGALASAFDARRYGRLRHSCLHNNNIRSCRNMHFCIPGACGPVAGESEHLEIPVKARDPARLPSPPPPPSLHPIHRLPLHHTPGQPAVIRAHEEVNELKVNTKVRRNFFVCLLRAKNTTNNNRFVQLRTVVFKA